MSQVQEKYQEAEILTQLELVVNTVSMEEAVQRQQEAEA